MSMHVLTVMICVHVHAKHTRTHTPMYNMLSMVGCHGCSWHDPMLIVSRDLAFCPSTLQTRHTQHAPEKTCGPYMPAPIWNKAALGVHTHTDRPDSLEAFFTITPLHQTSPVHGEHFIQFSQCIFPQHWRSTQSHLQPCEKHTRQKTMTKCVYVASLQLYLFYDKWRPTHQIHGDRHLQSKLGWILFWILSITTIFCD